MATRSLRSKPSLTRDGALKGRSKYAKAAQQKSPASSEEDALSDADEYNNVDDASEAESLDSDALDEDDSALDAGKKRKRGSSSPKKAPGRKNATKKATPKKTTPKKTTPKKATPSRKKRKAAKGNESEEEDDLDLEEGQEVVGVVVQAPKTGRVPPGQISRNTLNFLSKLKKPECNDREWFKLHEPVYRLAESEWKAFVENFTDLLVDVDPQIPHLPPKDVIHRIYRDIRFSNDKTPYKTGFSASFSRSGRKGKWAGYHIAVKPGGESLIAAGSWCPAKDELQTIRNNLLRSSRRLRRIISAPEFEAHFGPAMPHPKGARQNIFGFEDELKIAPKGIEKTHKDIDLLKCRSFAVVHKFTDEQVLSPNFKEELARVVGVVRPFVHCLNDLMTLQSGDSSDSEDEGEEDEQGDGDDAGED